MLILSLICVVGGILKVDFTFINENVIKRISEKVDRGDKRRSLR